MADFPAMPLWTDALLGDCGGLTDADFGLYMKVLIQMWRAPDGMIPDDDEWLAKRFGRSVEDVQRDMRPLLKQFCQKRGSMVTQRRLQRELAYVRSRNGKQSENAKSRWRKEKGLSHGIANAMPPHPIRKKEENDPLARLNGERVLVEAVPPLQGNRDGASGKAEDLTVSPALAAKYTGRHVRH